MQSVDARCQFPDAGGFAKWQIGNGKWQIKGHFVPIVKMPDASSQMPEALQNGKWQILELGWQLKSFGRSKQLEICDSLSLFFTAGKKEGGPTFNKFKIKG